MNVRIIMYNYDAITTFLNSLSFNFSIIDVSETSDIIFITINLYYAI